MVTLDVDHDEGLLDAPHASERSHNGALTQSTQTAKPPTPRSKTPDKPLADLPILKSISRNFAIRLAHLILLAITVLVLARLFWTLFAPLPYPQVAPTIVPAQRDQPSLADRIAARNPFAMTGAPGSDVVIAPSDDLKETALDLVLHGVSVYGEKSSAIIDVKNGDGQNSFPLGAQIVDGVTLEEVRFEEVVIERSGIREVLRMRDAEEGTSAGRSRLRDASLNANPRRATSIRNRAGAAPSRTNTVAGNANDEVTGAAQQEGDIDLRDLVSFRVRQDTNGNPALFLYPGRNRGAFAEAGLLPQDILVSINGAPAPQNLRRAYTIAEQAVDTGSINLVIERDGTPQSITIDIEQLITVQDPEALTLPTGDEVEL